MTPRPHAEIIRAWADGNDVQYRRPGSNEWVDSPDPAFVSDYIYRVKPEKVYPQSRMSYKEFSAAFDASNSHLVPFKLQHVANEAIRHAIDNGQVVPMSEVQEVARELAKRLSEETREEARQEALQQVSRGIRGLTQCLRDIRDAADRIFPSARINTTDGELLFSDYITRSLKAAGADVN